MSIYHCSIKIISRSGGRSAVASAAYRSGEKLRNEETGLIHDFTNKGGVVMNEILLPENAPKHLSDRSCLWNEVQQQEKRADAQLAREVEVAFPVELSRQEQIDCARHYISENFVSQGMIADWALHDKGDGNPHAHIMLTVRGFDENGVWTKKQRSVFANARDEDGKPIFDPSRPSYDPKDKEKTAQYRIPALDKNGNQKTRTRKGKGTEYLWEKVNLPENDWNDHANAEIWRASWAEHCNRYLTPDRQIDHRSFKRQGLNMEPTIHEGVTARQIEKEGGISDRCEINRGVRMRNRIRLQLKEAAKELTTYITEKARELYERFTKIGRDPGALTKTGRDDYAAGNTAEADRGTGSGEQNAPGAIEQITTLTTQMEDIKNDRDERIRKLMERRRASGTAGADAGPDRETADGERRNHKISPRGGDVAYGAGTKALIGNIRAAINAATSAEQAAGAERSNREAEQRRLDLERERAAEARSKRRKSYDHSL